MRGPARVVEVARGALDVPYPAKARILEELASDAEALYGHYRRAGWGRAASLREVEARLGVSVNAAEELAELHRPIYDRLISRYARGRQARLESALLLLTVLVALGSYGGAMLRLRLLESGSILPWVVLVSGAGAWVMAFVKVFHVVIRGDARLARLRSGLGWILALAGISAAAAVTSGFVEMYQAAELAVASPGRAMEVIVPWLRQSADLLVAVLATAIGVGIVWFLLETRVSALERTERRLASGPVGLLRLTEEGGGA